MVLFSFTIVCAVVTCVLLGFTVKWSREADIHNRAAEWYDETRRTRNFDAPKPDYVIKSERMLSRKK